MGVTISLRKLFPLTLLGLSLIACGGATSSSSDISGIESASSINVIDPQDVSSESALMAALLKGNSLAFFALGDTSIFPENAAYVTDPYNLHVFDPATEPLEIINEILCMVRKTGHNLKVNDGPYIAQINQSLCEQNGADTSTSGQSTGGSGATVNYEFWTVESIRESRTSNEIVKMWIPNEQDSEDSSEGENSMSGTIHVKMTITSAPTDTNKNGVFHADIRMVSGTTVLMEGFLESTFDSEQNSNRVNFRIDQGPVFSRETEAAVVIKDADEDGTVSRIYQSVVMETEPMIRDYNIASNASFVRIDYGDNESCKSRTVHDTYVWRSGLYSSIDGSGVDNGVSGFPIHSGDNYGYAGYWGIWMPEDITLADGSIITDFEDNNYTLSHWGFKLVRDTVEEHILSDFLNVRMNYYAPPESESDTSHNYEVVWNGSSFVKMCEISYTMDGPPSCADYNTPQTLTIPDTYPSVFFWLDGVGDVTMANTGSFSNSTVTKTIIRQVVDAADSVFSSGNLTLYGTRSQLMPNLTNEIMGGEPFLPMVESDNPYVLVINSTDGTASYTSGASGPISGDDLTSDISGNFSWGANSGPLYTSPSDITSSEVETYYHLEVGPNNWNKTYILSNNGSTVSFSKPLSCSYTHAATGKIYRIEYAGDGELHGIPWVEIESDDSEGDNDSQKMYRPEATIPDGSEISCRNSNGQGTTTYIVRAWEGEQWMSEVDPANCSSLNTDFTIDIPAANYVDPAIGDEPTDVDIEVQDGELL